MRREINLETGEEVFLPDAPPTDPVPPDLSAIDLSNLNQALIQDGSIIRALAEVIFQEINKLRIKTGDVAYTKPQFVTALKNQMRTP